MRVLVLWVRNCSRARALIVGAGRKRRRRWRRRRQRGRRRWRRRRRRRREVVEDDAGEPGTSQHGGDVRIRRRAGRWRPRRRWRRTEHGARLSSAVHSGLVQATVTTAGRRGHGTIDKAAVVDALWRDCPCWSAPRRLRSKGTLVRHGPRSSVLTPCVDVGRPVGIRGCGVEPFLGVMNAAVPVHPACISAAAVEELPARGALGVGRRDALAPAARAALFPVVARKRGLLWFVCERVARPAQRDCRKAAVRAKLDGVERLRIAAETVVALVQNLCRRAGAVKRVRVVAIDARHHKQRATSVGAWVKVDGWRRRWIRQGRRRRRRRRTRVVGHALEGVAVNGLREPVAPTCAVGGVGAEAAEAGQRVLVSVGGLGHKRRPRPTVLAHAVVAVRARVVLLDGPRIGPEAAVGALRAVLADRRQEGALAPVAAGRVVGTQQLAHELAARVGALGEWRRRWQRGRVWNRRRGQRRWRRGHNMCARHREGAQVRQVLGRAVPAAGALAVVGAWAGDDAVAVAEREVERARVDQPLDQRRGDAIVNVAHEVGAAQRGLALAVGRRRAVVLGKGHRRRRRKGKRRRRGRVGAGAERHLRVLAPPRILDAKLGLHVGQQEAVDSPIGAAVLAAQEAPRLVGCAQRNGRARGRDQSYR